MEHVVITGSGRGLGFALARAFLDHGCRVTISGSTESSTRNALERLRAAAPTRTDALDGVACDVRNTDSLERLWRYARARGPVDVWINNAGVSAELAPLWNVPSAALEAVVDTNVRGTLLGSWVALRGMREQERGTIYNLEGFGSDGSAVRGALAYGASKCAIGYVSRQLAREVRGESVRVCTIEPGAVHTDMTAAVWYGPGVSRHLLVGIESLALDADDAARRLAPRILANRRNGARVRPFPELVAWLRLFFIPLWAFICRKAPRSPRSSLP